MSSIKETADLIHICACKGGWAGGGLQFTDFPCSRKNPETPAQEWIHCGIFKRVLHN